MQRKIIDKAFAIGILLATGIVPAAAEPPFLRGGVGGVGGGGGPPPTGETEGCETGLTGDVCFESKNGQVFVRWTDMATEAAGAAWRYSMYRSASPLNSSNCASATLIASRIFNNSGQLVGGNPDNGTGTVMNTNTTRQSAAGEMTRLTDLGPVLDDFTGLQAYTILQNGIGYYCITADPYPSGTSTYIGAVGPIAETVADIKPVKIRDSMSRTDTAGRIDAPVSNLPVVFYAHGSSAGGGCAGDCDGGDYWEFRLPRDSSWQDGRAAAFSVRMSKSGGVPVLMIIRGRDTIWNPNGTGAMETYHQGLGMTPNPLVGPANRIYTSTANGYKHMINWAIENYGLDTNQLHWSGVSMGAWGGAQTGLRMTDPQFAALWLRHPNWRMDMRTSSRWAGDTWASSYAFAATAGTAPSTMGTIRENVLLSDGSTWGGTGGYADSISFIGENPGSDLPVALWVNTPYDQGFSRWSDQLAAVNAFQAARRGHHFVWSSSEHDTTYPTFDRLDCSSFGSDDGICYRRSDFKKNIPYLAFSGSSIDDNLGTGGTQANGMVDADYAGCINCGFRWSITSDTSELVEFTVDNTWMDRSPTPLPQSTLSAPLASSGGGAILQVTDGSVFTISSNNYFLINGLEVVKVSARSGNTLTISTRGRHGTTSQAHSAGVTIQQLRSKPTGPNNGPFTFMTVNVTPRRLTGNITSGNSSIDCNITPAGEGAIQQTIPVVDGLFTLDSVKINAIGATSVSCAPS